MTLSVYVLSILINFSWGFSPSLSVATSIISGGILGMIIGSNEMAPGSGAMTGGVTIGLIFTIFGSFSADIGSPLLFFTTGIITGAVIGSLCAIFVHMVSFK
ncbi:MAG: hypothetical protein PF545_01295 [Elusimicrobia bacterium]|nr:hypothetical protein [Elusimicrobiota bacterium]